MHILFVCTGNTCRSPMAAALANAISAPGPKGAVTAASAGIAAWEGAPASAHAVAAMAARGLDISGHAARLVSEALIAEAHRVFAMGEGHKQVLCKNFAAHRDKIFTLRTEDICDPFGQNLEVYEQCAAEIERAVAKIAEEWP